MESSRAKSDVQSSVKKPGGARAGSRHWGTSTRRKPGCVAGASDRVVHVLRNGDDRDRTGNLLVANQIVARRN